MFWETEKYFKVMSIMLLLTLLILAPGQTTNASWLKDTFEDKLAMEVYLYKLHLDESPWEVTASVEKEGFDKGIGRYFQELTLNGSPTGPIRLSISAPTNFNEAPSAKPVLFVLGGLQSGRDSVYFIDSAGDNIVVSLDYPFPKDNPSLKDLGNLPKTLYEAPGHIAVALDWLERQDWAESDRINLMGVSLGSLLLPASLRLASHQGFQARSVVLAYGGADATQFLRHALDEDLGPIALSYLSGMAKLVLAPLDPVNHLPYLKVPFCLINGTEDQVIPMSAVERLHETTPSPKTVIWLEGPHINVDTFEIIHRLNQETQNWLRAQGAIN